MNSIDKESVQILTNNLLDFMKGKEDQKEFCYYLFSQLTEIFPTDIVLEWFLDWARSEGKEKS